MPSALPKVNLPWYFVFHNVTTAAATVVYEYVSAERCALSELLLVARPEPARANCSLATEKRAAHRLRVGWEATSLFSCVTIQLINRFAAACCRGKHLLETSPFFDLKISWPKSLDFWAKP